MIHTGCDFECRAPVQLDCPVVKTHGEILVIGCDAISPRFMHKARVSLVPALVERAYQLLSEIVPEFDVKGGSRRTEDWDQTINRRRHVHQVGTEDRQEPGEVFDHRVDHLVV